MKESQGHHLLLQMSLAGRGADFWGPNFPAEGWAGGQQACTLLRRLGINRALPVPDWRWQKPLLWGIALLLGYPWSVRGKPWLSETVGP